MIINRYSSILALLLAPAFHGSAEDLNTEITVTHEVVPEEQAATRLRLQPVVTLPAINAGRLAAASRFVPSALTPFVSSLSAAPYLDSLTRYPWRGYASLSYGPVYNLAASAGYRFIETDNLTLDAYMQFDGTSYTSSYPAIAYDGRVCFRRNTALAGARTAWKSSAGTLDASLLYQYSGYNFPILDLPTLLTDHNTIYANVVKANVGWGASAGSVTYRIAADYGMLYYGRNLANNNRVALTGAVDWQASSKSVWGLDVAYSLDHSELVGNKGIVHILPRYAFAVNAFKVRLGVDVDVKTGNCAYKPAMLVAPDLNIVWQPSAYFNIWGKLSGRMDDNSRLALLDEQPYLLSDFDAGLSRIYTADAGLTLGPLRGASLSVFGGYAIARDWYMPSVATGYMTPIDVKGAHAGVSFAYDYRRYLSLNVRAEIAQSPRGDYSRGYALWRDHAKFNLTAQATVHPISGLDITLAYHLRTGREKQLPVGDLPLQNINNLQAGVSYRITDSWTAYVRGENLLNRHWYLGPAVPNQGIMGMIGAAYKF